MLLVSAVGLAACSPAGTDATATVAAQDTATAAIEHGRALFRNKGCVTCHRNSRVEGTSGALQVAPDLSNYTNDADFLRQWLADPASVRPTTSMPDLDLTDAEIEDLIDFLNEPR